MFQEKGSDLLIGDIIATRQSPISRHVFELGVCVRKAYWGAGVGRALFEAATEAAREMGAERLELGVYSHNHRAIRMYERAGFTREGLQRHSSKFGPDTYYDDILMGRFLINESTIAKNMTESRPTETKNVDFTLSLATSDDVKELLLLVGKCDMDFDIDTIGSEKDGWMTEERQCISNKDVDKTIYLLAKVCLLKTLAII